MKKIIYAILFVTVFFKFNTLKAQNNFTLDQFSIPAQFLVNGKVMQNTSNSAMPINANFRLVRFYNNAIGAYYNVDCTVTLMFSNTDGSNAQAISNPMHLVSSNFSGQICNRTLTGSYPANTTSGKIYIKYTFYLYDSFNNRLNHTDFNYSSTQYAIYQAPPPPTLYQTVQVRRFINKSTSDHVYTTWPSEISNLLASKSFREEGSPGRIYVNQVPGSIPLHRYVKANGRHQCVPYQYTDNHIYEGIIGYVFTNPFQDPETGQDLIPAYNYTQLPVGGSRGWFWTTNYGELWGGNGGWWYNGIFWYIHP